MPGIINVIITAIDRSFKIFRVPESPLSDEQVEKGWCDLMNIFNFPYVEYYHSGMKTILSFVNEKTPSFVLTTLSKNLTERSDPDSILQSQILYIFMNNPTLWEKLTDEERDSVNSFVTTTVVSEPDRGQRLYLSQMMLKKVAIQFREAYPPSSLSAEKCTKNYKKIV